jgi:hypothetical protein
MLAKPKHWPGKLKIETKLLSNYYSEEALGTLLASHQSSAIKEKPL